MDKGKEGGNQYIKEEKAVKKRGRQLMEEESGKKE